MFSNLVHRTHRNSNGLPDGWSQRSLRSLAREPIRNGVGESAQAFNADWPRYVRITDIAGRITLKSNTVASLPPELAAGAPLRAGDLLIAAVGATYGKSYLHVGGGEPACYAGFLVRVAPTSNVSPSFLSYWAMSTHYWDQVNTSVIQSTIQNLSAARIKRLRVLVPPEQEQASIVRYLDHAHLRIDRAIQAKRKLITLLEEQKRVIIQQAVTGGLDPRAPLKDTKMSWLSQVPSHWVIRRAKNFLREVDERSLSGLETQLSVSHITGVTPRKSTVTMFRAESYVGHKVCRPGDLVVNTMWAWMGALGFAHEDGIVSPSYGVFRLRPQSAITAGYLDLLLRTPQYISQIKAESTGIRPSRLRLYPYQLLAMSVVVPPESEQLEIVKYVERRSQEFVKLVDKTQAEIELLREFRTRLTSDVVTGNIDVRHLAEALPAVTEEMIADSIDEEVGELLEDDEAALEEVYE